jgi:hypothetical protein
MGPWSNVDRNLGTCESGGCKKSRGWITSIGGGVCLPFQPFGGVSDGKGSAGSYAQ